MIEFGSWTMQAYYVQQSAKGIQVNLRSNSAMAMQATTTFPILKSSTLHWFDYTAMTSLSIVLNYTHSAELCKECMRGISV